MIGHPSHTWNPAISPLAPGSGRGAALHLPDPQHRRRWTPLLRTVEALQSCAKEAVPCCEVQRRSATKGHGYENVGEKLARLGIVQECESVQLMDQSWIYKSITLNVSNHGPPFRCGWTR